ncbi:MAG: CoA-binding protein [Dehalococcoidia bacterium]|nr:MAG: CoA-binding protein [Dehalococcoidia bacterium]
MKGDESKAFAELEAIFHPRAIAVAGASAKAINQGHEYVRCLLEFSYRGAVYPINPNLDEVLGLKAYPSLLEVPGPVDYVISCIPAAGVLKLVDDCARKGVKAIHFFTARFSETGRQEAALLEEELKRRAQRAGIRIIGPNCMGLYHPKEGISFRPELPREAGPVGFLSQSGGNAVEFCYHGSLRGLRFSKVISYGNGLDLNEVDFLEYFARDEETRIIAVYVEGVSDGRRFLAALKRAAARKPVVTVKGGRTAAGTHAAASHTAALAGAQQVWRAAVRQAGALEVSTLEDLIDMLLAFAFLPVATGLRVGVVGGGGGRMVQSADLCEEAGLSVPSLPGEMREELRQRAPEIWDWVINPADQSILAGTAVTGMDILEMMAGRPEFDLLIGNVGEDWILELPIGPQLLQYVVERFIGVAGHTPKPLAVVLGPADSPEERRWRAVMEAHQRLASAGLAVYPTIERAGRAMAALVRYHRERQEQGAD